MDNSLNNLDSIMGTIIVSIVLILLLSPFVYYAVKIFKLHKLIQANRQASEKASSDYRSRLIEDGLNITNDFTFKNCSIFVDELSKRWSIKTGFNSIYKIYSYNDLVNYDLSERYIDHVLVNTGFQELSRHKHCLRMILDIQVNDPEYPKRSVMFLDPNVIVDEKNIDIVTIDTGLKAYRTIHEAANRFCTLLQIIKDNRQTQ